MNALARLLLACLLLAMALPGRAAVDLVGDDTDLFTRNPNIPSQIPNVLFVLDNSPNWSRQSENWPAVVDPACNAAGITGNTQGDAQICAIYKTLANLDEQVNVGLMLFNDQNEGAYVRFPMLPMSTTNKTALRTVVKDIAAAGTGVNEPSNKASASANYDNPMNDVFRYFNSLPTYTSPGPPNINADGRGYTSATTKTTFKFLENSNGTSCGYDYVIFIGNKFPNASTISPAIDQAAALLNDTGVVVNKDVLQATGVNTDVWSRFLFQYGVKVANGVYRHITTYTIDICNAHCEADQQTLLTSMATASQGKYFRATSLAQIETSLSQIFTEVQAVNSVFAATTLPVSINVRGTNLNQVYIGVFRPDPGLSPRWLGNLKQYKLGVVNSTTGQLGLVDANDVNAVNLNTGFIANTATSIWTERQGSTSSLTDGFWAYRTPFAQTDAGKDEDLPDGDLVEKGGAAQKIRQYFQSPDSTSAQSRSIYTCTACTSDDTNSFTGKCTVACTAGQPLKGYRFNAANGDVTAQLLGAFATINVTSLTGSGSTATVTTATNHGFDVSDAIVISGATPDLYNSPAGGSWTVLSKTDTTFTYSIAPGSFDTTNAYVTLPSYNVRPGTDTITVTSASPSTYNVTNATIAGVVGNLNQFSYALGSSVTSAASGYSVTANRRASSLVYSSGTGRVTATVPSHGYAAPSSSVSVSPSVVISGAADSAFNGTFAVLYNVTTNTFEYTPTSVPGGGSVTTAVASPIPSQGLTAGTSIVVIAGSGNSTYNTTQACTATAISNVTAVDGTAGTFTYRPGGNVTGSSTGTVTARICVTADMDTYAITAASSGSGNSLNLTIGAGTPLVTGQAVRTLAVGDKIAVKGVTCTGRTCNTTSSVPTPTSTVFTFTVNSVSGSTINVTPGGNGNLGTITRASDAALYWTGATLSATPTTLTLVTAGSATVSATGTIYSSKVGDLTSSITSITSQAVATPNPTIQTAKASSEDVNERTNLIAWVRGQDNKDNENRNAIPTDVRASIHGDVLHSRPAVVNYNRNSTSSTVDDNDVYIFYGANDGLLHAIKGGSLASGGGREKWAFVPPEFFGRLKRLRDQNPKISSTRPRDYFFDGPIGVYTLDADRNGKLESGTGDKVHLFIGMRRGGRMLYALDVTDPEDPKLLWRKGCRNATGSETSTPSGNCDSGYGEMGQTWSEPKLGYLRKWPDKLVLMVAAGYDQPIEDLHACFVKNWYYKATSSSTAAVVAKTGIVVPTPMDQTNCKAITDNATIGEVTKTRSMGRGIFFIDAANGSVLYRIGPDAGATKQVAEMEFAMPGDLAVMRKRDNAGGRTPDIGNESVAAGYLDRVYATDTGGNIWRIDVSDTGTPPNFAVSKLASLASTTGSLHPAQNYRKFLFNPDVVYSNESDGTKYDAVLIGSGDREHPFDMVVMNRFYMLKDKNVGTLTQSQINDGATEPAKKWAAPGNNGTNSVLDETNLFDVTDNCLGGGSCTGSASTAAEARTQLRAASGWKLLYAPAKPGEKTVATATTAAGTVIFNTNQPKQDTVTGTISSCTSDLGTARQYGLNYQDATATGIFSSLPVQYVEAGGRDAMFAGGGFLPTPVPVVVQIGGKYYQTVIAGVQTTNPGGLKLQTRLRTYWYRKTD